MKCNLKSKTNKNRDTSKAPRELSPSGRSSYCGHAQWFSIVPRLAGAIVASEAKQTKNKPNSRSNRAVCVLTWFLLDLRPFFSVFWKDIFTWGGRDLVRPQHIRFSAAF
jgi:hypothetical protein